MRYTHEMDTREMHTYEVQPMRYTPIRYPREIDTHEMHAHEMLSIGGNGR
jgi:hypothetical protein